jgi:hypothetical protein
LILPPDSKPDARGLGRPVQPKGDSMHVLNIESRADFARVPWALTFIIVFLSLPAMIVTFLVMRKGAPTRPLFAGAVIGLLSASVGAMAYTLACKNDGTAFVAIWYTVACVIMVAIGAVVGYRVLRW